MVRYTGKNGKEYILRFDMSVMEALKEKYGGAAESMQKLKSSEAEAVKEIFVIMAQAGAEYLAEQEGRFFGEQISGEGLIGRHSSIGRIKGMMKAIQEAVADGNRMQSKDEEDDQIRDGYLDELNAQEKEKN